MSRNTFGLQESAKFARSLANAQGIRVVEDKGVFSPYSREDGSIVVGEPGIYSPEDYIGSLHREISKHVPKMSKLFFSQKEAEGSLRELAKAIIQEQRCEYEGHGRYDGRDSALADSYERTISEAGGLQKIMSQVPPEIAALLYHGNELRNQWQGYVPSGEPPEELKDIIEKTSSVKDKWLSLETPEELDEILQYITIEEHQDGQQGGSKGSKGSGDPQGEGQGSGDGAEGDEGSSSEGEGQGEGSGGESSSDSGVSQDEESGGNQYSKAFEYLKNSNLLKPPRKYKDKPKKKEAPYSCTKVETVDLSLNLHPQTRASDMVERRLGSFSLSKKIRKYLLATNQTGYEYGLKRGKLVNKRISSLYTTSESQEPRIFKQKRATKIHVDSAVYVLGDCSGSMDGRKYVTSAACQVAISELLQDLRIPHKMLQFTSSGALRRHFVMKRFDEASVSRDKLLSRYGSSGIYMGSNADGEAVMEASQELMNRPEKNKILLVLSDGQPAFMGGDDRYLEDVVKVIEESKAIHLYGIGIMDNSVEKFYTNHKVVMELTELEHVLMDLLSKNILK